MTLDLPGFQLQVAEHVPLTGVTAITGPSGSGKTTFLRVLAGLENATQGTIRFAGRVWQDGTTRVATPNRRLGVVFQDARLFPHLDVAGNLAYGARRRGVGADYVARVVAALQIGPLLDRRVDALSGGEGRRVAVARALACDPHLLLLDEPLSGLDADRRAETLQVIADAVRDLNVPALYVSHAADEVAALADRVLRFEGGTGRGWQAAPLILTAVARAGASGVALQLGDAVLPTHHYLAEGARVAISVAPDDLLISRNAPGDSTAACSLAANVLGLAADGQVRLSIDGQAISVPLSGALLANPPVPGQVLWLSVNRFWLRGGTHTV